MAYRNLWEFGVFDGKKWSRLLRSISVRVQARTPRALRAAFVLIASACTLKAQQPASDVAAAKPIVSFPSPDVVLRDASHKEQKSGVQLQGNQLTIASGVGTATVINSLSFSADGKILAAGKDFGRVAVWNVGDGKFLRALETNQGIVNVVAVSPDGKSVATSGNLDGNSVKIWEVATGKLVWTFKGSNSPVGGLFFHSLGNFLVVANNTSTVYVVNISEHNLVTTLKEVHAIGMTTDGQSLLTVDEKEFGVWSMQSWSKTQSVPKWNKFSMLLAADTSQDQLAAYESRSVRTVKISTAEIVLDRSDLVPKNFTSRPTFAGFSSDGGMLYLSLGDRLLISSTRSTDTCGTTVMYSGAAALSPDGKWFAGAKDDSILSKERTDGVWIWNTSKLREKCGLTEAFNSK